MKVKKYLLIFLFIIPFSSAQYSYATGPNDASMAYGIQNEKFQVLYAVTIKNITNSLAIQKKESKSTLIDFKEAVKEANLPPLYNIIIDSTSSFTIKTFGEPDKSITISFNNGEVLYTTSGYTLSKELLPPPAKVFHTTKHSIPYPLIGVVNDYFSKLIAKYGLGLGNDKLISVSKGLNFPNPYTMKIMPTYIEISDPRFPSESIVLFIANGKLSMKSVGFAFPKK